MADRQISPARDELNGMVISVELTLISIIQGAALYFLINTSIDPIIKLQFEYWPYTAGGLIIIFLVWSRSLMHIFTLIQWPIEFGHNFLYITLTLVEAVWFTQLASPHHWFAIAIIFWLMGWVTFAFDMRMIRSRKEEYRGTKFHELLEITEREQRFNIRLALPGVISFYVFAAWAVQNGWPASAGSNAHLIFALLQLCCFIGYLVYSLSFFRKISPLILASRQEIKDTPDSEAAQITVAELN